MCLCGVARRCCTHGLGHVKRRRVSGAARTPRGHQRVSETHTPVHHHQITPGIYTSAKYISLHRVFFSTCGFICDGPHRTVHTAQTRPVTTDATWPARGAGGACAAVPQRGAAAEYESDAREQTLPTLIESDVRHKVTSSIGVPRSVTRRAPRLAVARAPGIMATLKLREEGGVSIGEVRRGLRCVAGGHASGMVRLA